MKTTHLLLSIALLYPLSGLAKTSVAVLPTQANADARTYAEPLRGALEYSLAQTNWLRVLTPEERSHLAIDAGTIEPGPCVSNSCFQISRRLYGVQLVVGTSLDVRGDSLFVQLEVHDSTGNISSHAFRCPLRTSPLAIAKELVAHTWGFPFSESDSLVALPPNPHRHHKAAYLVSNLAALAALGGVAYAWGWVQPEYGDQAGTRSSADFPGLSGIRGFFADRPPVARFRALGGAGVACRLGSNPGVINPAGWTGLSQPWLSFASGELPGGAPQNQSVFASPLSPGFWHAQTVRFAGDGLARELSASTALATDLTVHSPWLAGIRAGIEITGRLVQVGEEGDGVQRSRGSGLGIGGTLGLQWDLNSDLTIGTVLRDLYAPMWYHNELTGQDYRESIPPEWVTGAAWQAPGGTLLMADLTKSVQEGQSDRISAGFEHEFFQVLALRGGMFRILQNGLTSWSAGAGAKAKAGELLLRIDYTWEEGGGESGILDSHHLVTVGTSF